MLARDVDQLAMVEQRAGAENDCRFAAPHERLDDRRDEMARRAFDDQIGDIDQVGNRADRWRLPQPGKKIAMLLGITDGDGA
jgi:hypothetical protein